MKKIDTWTISAAFIVVFIASFFIANRGKYQMCFFVISGLSAILTAILAYNSKSKIIKNDYQGNIYLLPEEDNGEPQKLKPGETRAGFDGLATPTRPGEVFKVYNGTFVQVEKDGNITIVSPFTRLINPGFVKLDFFKEYDRKKWQPLFEAVKKI